MSPITLLAVILTWLTACSPGNKNQNTIPLFDLKNYFESQVAALKQSNPKVQKRVVQNGQVESRDMQIEDWNAELKPFLESDISKPALRNSYKVDTLEEGHHIIYTAVDSSQSVRIVDLVMDKNSVSRISILKGSGGLLLQSMQSLTWSPRNGYSITGNQSVSMGKGNDYSVKVTFLN